MHVLGDIPTIHSGFCDCKCMFLFKIYIKASANCPSGNDTEQSTCPCYFWLARADEEGFA